MSKREIFQQYAKNLMSGFEFRLEIAAKVKRGPRAVLAWIKADNPGLMTDEVVELVMKKLDKKERSDVTELVDVTEPVNA